MHSCLKFLVIASSVAMLASGAFAQLSKEDATKVRKATIQVDKAVRELGKANKEFDRGSEDGKIISAAEMERVMRYLDNADSALSSAESELAGASGAAEVTAVREKIGTLKSDAIELRERAAGAKEKSEGNEESMLATADTDLPIVDGLIEAMEDFREGFLSVEITDEFRGSWSKALTDADAMIAKYRGVGQSEKTKWIIGRAKLLSVEKLGTLSERDNQMGFVPERANDWLSIAERITNDVIAQSAWARFQTEVFYRLVNSEALAKNYRAFTVGTARSDDGVAVGIEKRVAGIRAKIKEYEEKIIAQNKPWSNSYKGGDLANLKNFATSLWAKENPSHKILQVNVIDAAWSRSAHWEWSNANARWEKHDYSKVRVAVVVDAGDGKFAYEYVMPLFLLHLQGGALGGKAWKPAPGRPVDPYMIMLRSAVK